LQHKVQSEGKLESSSAFSVAHMPTIAGAGGSTCLRIFQLGLAWAGQNGTALRRGALGGFCPPELSLAELEHA